MMYLVVNADDAGVDAPRNRGILRAFRDGIVTSASVLAGFPDSEAFLSEAARVRSETGTGLGLGLHLNLSEGCPLAAGSRTLAGPDGRFPGKFEVWRRALRSELDPAEVFREVEAQWRWLIDRGIEPDHIDGHNHVHILPAVAEAIGEIVPHGAWARLPCEETPSFESLSAPPEEIFGDPARLRGTLSALSSRLAERWAGELRFPDGFLGIGLVRGFTVEELVGVLDRLLEDRRPSQCWWRRAFAPDRIIELMVHPGEIDPSSVPFSAAEGRELELRTLTNQALRASIEGKGLRLLPFGALP